MLDGDEGFRRIECWQGKGAETGHDAGAHTIHSWPSSRPALRALSVQTGRKCVGDRGTVCVWVVAVLLVCWPGGAVWRAVRVWGRTRRGREE